MPKQMNVNEIILRSLERMGSKDIQKDYAKSVGILLNKDADFMQIGNSVFGYITGGKSKGAYALTFTMDSPAQFISNGVKVIKELAKKGLTSVVFTPKDDNGFRMIESLAKKTKMPAHRVGEYVVVMLESE